MQNKENTEHVALPVSLRDWFAGQALVGLVASYAGSSCAFNPDADAEHAYKFADAMIAARLPSGQE